jgi:hypothetical protein
MSDYLAVGGVSAVLCSMLTGALAAGGPSPLLGGSPTPVTANPPDLIPTGQGEQPQLNLFMYYVSLNPALRNSDLPSQNGQGQRINNPPLALNLHYLITAYGGKQFDAEILLAWGMKVFHDTPVVSPQTIQAALSGLAGQPNPEAQLISASTLAEQIEHLRITPETLTTEEIYRLWAAFQATYRPSTAFQVSVVMIQDTDDFSSNQVVQSRTVAVQPAQAPVVASISPAMATAGQVVTISGANFVGDSASETIVSLDYGPGFAPNTVTGSTVTATLPVTLQAGIHKLRVERQIGFAGSPTLYPGFSSLPASFQLIPTIENASPIAAPRSSPLVLTIAPPVGQAQAVTLYVGDRAIPIDQRPVTGPPSSATLSFSIPPDVSDGTYSVRVEVDGAQSALIPIGGGHFSPQVVVTG